jgi:hypothetical protein
MTLIMAVVAQIIAQPTPVIIVDTCNFLDLFLRDTTYSPKPPKWGDIIKPGGISPGSTTERDAALSWLEHIYATRNPGAQAPGCTILPLRGWEGRSPFERRG